MNITGERFEQWLCENGAKPLTAKTYRASASQYLDANLTRIPGANRADYIREQLLSRKPTVRRNLQTALNKLFKFIDDQKQQTIQTSVADTNKRYAQTLDKLADSPIDADYDLVSLKEFATIMGSSSVNLGLQLKAHPKSPKPIAKFNGLDAWRRVDAVNFKALIVQEKKDRAEKAEAARKAEEASLREHAQAKQKEHQELNVLRMQLEAANRIIQSKQELADQRLRDRESAESENQRLTVTVNAHAKTVAELDSKVKELEAMKRKFLSFMGWLSQVSGCPQTTEFDTMKANIQACLEKAQNPDVEKLVATYKSGAELAERNYQRINAEHLKLLDEHKVMKQNLAWFDILVEHCGNFMSVSHNQKPMLWPSERAAIWRTLQTMGKLKPVQGTAATTLNQSVKSA